MTAPLLTRTAPRPAASINQPTMLTPVAASRSRLEHLDVLRVLACLSVVTVHVVSTVNVWDGPVTNAVAHFFHYGREVFFFVMALVLVRSFAKTGRDDAMAATTFRLRRLRLLGVPYLVWTFLYLAMVAILPPLDRTAIVQAPLRYANALVVGDGYYHLYFLLVSVQFGLALPVFVRLLHFTAGQHGTVGRHAWVLGASAALQAGTLFCYHYLQLKPVNGYQAVIGESSLLAYQFWLVLGGLMAFHYERVHRWLANHWCLVTAVALVGVGVSQFVYWTAVRRGESPFIAGQTLQPVTMLWSIAAIGFLYVVAHAITSRAGARLLAIVRRLGVLSFGIFLLHPALLTLYTTAVHWSPVSPLNRALNTVAVLAALVAATTALAAVIHRTPASLALIGRPRKRRTARRARVTDDSEAAAVAGSRPRRPTTETG